MDGGEDVDATVDADPDVDAEVDVEVEVEVDAEPDPDPDPDPGDDPRHPTIATSRTTLALTAADATLAPRRKGMPEEAIETQELKERLEEANEHAEGEHAHAAKWILQLSLSTALIAVFAAIAALESGAYANDAIVQKNDAILHQSKASDAWAWYQARGIKAAVYGSQAVASPAAAPALGGKAKDEIDKQEEQKKTASEEEAKSEDADKESAHSLHTHHRFATSVTIFQVAIALAAIAALARRKPLWYVSLVVGLGGLFFFVRGFLPF